MDSFAYLEVMAQRREMYFSKLTRKFFFLAVGVVFGISVGVVWYTIVSKNKLPAPTATRGTEFSQAKDRPSDFVGSESCQKCHAEAFAAWAHSHHALAERTPRADLDVLAFAPPRTFQHGSQQTTVRTNQARYELVTAGLRATNEAFAVQRVLAHSPLRQMLVEFPGGRLQATEAAWDSRSNKWFNVYGAEDRKPGEWGHWTGRGMNWNSMCASCHNTYLQKNYDATTDSYRTTM
ncbi:MAG: hypothetical protein RL380_565, partial [Verrucomicrobiota bacterium]